MTQADYVISAWQAESGDEHPATWPIVNATRPLYSEGKLQKGRGEGYDRDRDRVATHSER